MKKTNVQNTKNTKIEPSAGTRVRSSEGAKREARRKKVVAKVGRAIKSSTAPVIDVRGLSGRDANFVRKKLEGKSNTTAMQEAAAEVGVVLSEKSASVAASKALEKAEVASAIEMAFSRAGIDDDRIANVISQGLGATKFNAQGLEYDDHATRLQFARTVMQVKKQLGADTSNTQQSLNYFSFKGDD